MLLVWECSNVRLLLDEKLPLMSVGRQKQERRHTLRRNSVVYVHYLYMNACFNIVWILVSLFLVVYIFYNLSFIFKMLTFGYVYVVCLMNCVLFIMWQL